MSWYCHRLGCELADCPAHLGDGAVRNGNPRRLMIRLGSSACRRRSCCARCRSEAVEEAKDAAMRDRGLRGRSYLCNDEVFLRRARQGCGDRYAAPCARDRHRFPRQLERVRPGPQRELEGHRHEYVIASKFGNLRAADGSPARQGTGPLHPNRVMVLRFDLGQSSKERFAFCCRPESEPSLLDQIGSRKLRRGNRQCEELSIWFPARVARRLIQRTLIWLLAPAKRNVGKIART